MNVDELREALAEFPGYYPVTIAMPTIDPIDGEEDGEDLVDVEHVAAEGMNSIQVVIR